MKRELELLEEKVRLAKKQKSDLCLSVLNEYSSFHANEMVTSMIDVRNSKPIFRVDLENLLAELTGWTIHCNEEESIINKLFSKGFIRDYEERFLQCLLTDLIIIIGTNCINNEDSYFLDKLDTFKNDHYFLFLKRKFKIKQIGWVRK